jgi:hypothetical protein
VLTVAAVAAFAATEHRRVAFAVGVASFEPAAVLRPGDEVCQQPVRVVAEFDRIQAHIGTYRSPGPRLSVTIRGSGGTRIARADLPPGYQDNSRPVIAVGKIRPGGAIAVCLRNHGTRKVAVYGGAGGAVPTSSAVLNGRRIDHDLNLVMLIGRPSTTLALLPNILDRASLFRGAWIGVWLYWVLLAGVIVAAPALIALALRSATQAEDGPRAKDDYDPGETA